MDEKIRPINLDNWKPKELDKERVLKQIYDFYEFSLNEVEEKDQADETLELYNKVTKKDLESCKNEIQDFFTEMYYAVDGNIEDCYNENLIELIKLTVL